MSKIPNLVTLLGLILSVAGLADYPSNLSLYLLTAGLICDVADGRLARMLDAETERGGLFEWYVDVTVGAALLTILGEWPLLLALPLWLVWCHVKNIPNLITLGGNGYHHYSSACL